ncbi:hypothetical protein [Streptomyces sp. NBC_01615]|uniref:hypothetical protein n=1 Tax=Streptomyces sp. NBC_01615 TaxID=2975898 RepID=UPI00386E0EFE
MFPDPEPDVHAHLHADPRCICTLLRCGGSVLAPGCPTHGMTSGAPSPGTSPTGAPTADATAPGDPAHERTAAVPQADTPLDTADLSTLADRQQAWFTTGHGPVSVRRYARSSDFVRAAVRSANGRDRAALLTLHPEAYPLAPAWLAAIAEAAPETADHHHPSAAMPSVRLLARMTPDHRNEAPSCPDPYCTRRPRRPPRVMTTAGASTAACPAPSR